MDVPKVDKGNRCIPSVSLSPLAPSPAAKWWGQLHAHRPSSGRMQMPLLSASERPSPSPCCVNLTGPLYDHRRDLERYGFARGRPYKKQHGAVLKRAASIRHVLGAVKMVLPGWCDSVLGVAKDLSPLAELDTSGRP